MLSEYPDVLTVEEFRRALRISKTSAYKMVKDGRVRSVRIGKKYIVTKKSVLDFRAEPEYNAQVMADLTVRKEAL